MQIIKNHYPKVLVGVSLLLGLVFITLSKKDVTDERAHSVSSPAPEVAAVSKEKDALTEGPSGSENKTPQIEGSPEDPFEGRELKYRFQQIADQFAEDIQYPSFSRPIRNEFELIEYKPNRAVSTSRPINIDDPDAEVLEDSPRISLKTSQFNYYPGEQVMAEAEVTGLTDSSTISLDATVRVEGKVIARAHDITSIDSDNNDGSRKYTLRFSDLSNMSGHDQGDMDVVAEFKIDGRRHHITSLIRYPNTVARFEGIGAAEVENEYLLIPVHITTSSPGIHAVKGNLYIADTDTPLVHLNAVERLTSEEGVMVLKAHISALKKMGHEGPYELRDISLTRGASAPKYTVEQGLVEMARYTVSGFSFSEYDEIAYVDERAQARLDFLTKLGSVN